MERTVTFLLVTNLSHTLSILKWGSVKACFFREHGGLWLNWWRHRGRMGRHGFQTQRPRDRKCWWVRPPPPSVLNYPILEGKVHVLQTSGLLVPHVCLAENSVNEPWVGRLRGMTWGGCGVHRGTGQNQAAVYKSWLLRQGEAQQSICWVREALKSQAEPSKSILVAPDLSASQPLSTVQGSMVSLGKWK